MNGAFFLPLKSFREKNSIKRLRRTCDGLKFFGFYNSLIAGYNNSNTNKYDEFIRRKQRSLSWSTISWNIFVVVVAVYYSSCYCFFPVLSTLVRQLFYSTRDERWRMAHTHIHTQEEKTTRNDSDLFTTTFCPVFTWFVHSHHFSLSITSLFQLFPLCLSLVLSQYLPWL